MTEWSAIAAAKPVYCFTMLFLGLSVKCSEQHMIDGNMMIIQLLHLTSHREHPDKTACASDTQKGLKWLPEVIELERILNVSELGMSHIFPQSNCGRWLPEHWRSQQGPLLRELGENFIAEMDMEFCSASGIIIPHNS